MDSARASQGGQGSSATHPLATTLAGCPTPLTLVLVAPACNLALVSGREGAAGLRQADGLDELGADGTAVSLLLQPDQDWAGERPQISLGCGGPRWTERGCSPRRQRGCGLGDPEGAGGPARGPQGGLSRASSTGQAALPHQAPLLPCPGPPSLPPTLSHSCLRTLPGSSWCLPPAPLLALAWSARNAQSQPCCSPTCAELTKVMVTGVEH